MSDLKKLASFIDIKHSCGYVTLMNFKMEDKGRSQVIMDLNTPKNGDVKKENAQLLEEELDRLDDDEPMDDKEV